VSSHETDRAGSPFFSATVTVPKVKTNNACTERWHDAYPLGD